MQKISGPERGKKKRQFIHVCGVKMTRWPQGLKINKSKERANSQAQIWEDFNKKKSHILRLKCINTAENNKRGNVQT